MIPLHLRPGIFRPWRVRVDMLGPLAVHRAQLGAWFCITVLSETVQLRRPDPVSSVSRHATCLSMAVQSVAPTIAVGLRCQTAFGALKLDTFRRITSANLVSSRTSAKRNLCTTQRSSGVSKSCTLSVTAQLLRAPEGQGFDISQLRTVISQRSL